MKLSLTQIFILLVPIFSHAQPSTLGDEPTTQLNGKIPPGVVARSLQEEHVLNTPDGKGNQIIVERTTREAGTRTPIHLHDYGGVTCVLEGEMTLYLEGSEPKRAQAGMCYYMPAGLKMAGVNSGQTAAVMDDIFTIPNGENIWRVVEKGSESYQDQFTKHH